MLEARDVHKSYGDVIALRGVSLAVSPGEIVALLGPNGAGKTTLISITAGLRRADSGTVTIGPANAAPRSREARRLLGLAPQDLGIYPVLSVADNLGFFGRIAGLTGAELNRRIVEVAELFSLGGALERTAGNLSGGQKRRLHTAAALLHGPPLLILDEPTAGADPTMRSDLLGLVGELAAGGTAVCYSTHYLNEVESLGARVVIIDHGAVVAEGSAAELIAAHAAPGEPPTLESVFSAVTTGDSVLAEAVG